MTQLGKYEILVEIGRGGFGVVYRAVDTALKVERALKVLHPALVFDPHLTARFIREAQVAAGLEHPHIVPVYDIGEAEGRIYLAMKYMPGGSLKERLAAQGKLALPQAVEIISQVCAGLDFAHQRKIVHRDLKPGNILFDENGGVRMSDFGFAKVLSETASTSFTMSGGILGTPAYMAPELWNGPPPPSPATDIYALACVVFEILTGEVLFFGDTPAAVMLKHFQPLPDLGQKLAQYPSVIKQTIEKALAKDFQERYQGTNNYFDALTQVQKPPEPVVTEKQKPAADLAAPRSESTEYQSPLVSHASRIIDEFHLVLPGDVTMDFVYVPAGEFLMGSEDDDAYTDEKPQHKVYLDGYWIGKYPVTNAQYQAYVRDGGNPPCDDIFLYDSEKIHHPVVAVSWYHATKFYDWLSQYSGEQICLPTEAQWEKAARGDGDSRKFPWGNANLSGLNANYCDSNCEYDWKDNSQDDGYAWTAPVGSYPDGASPYRVLDMAGNVWEWVADWYNADYYSRSDYENPIGPQNGESRVLRGGSWYSDDRYLRVSYRGRYNPDYWDFYFGFRCLRLP